MARQALDVDQAAAARMDQAPSGERLLVTEVFPGARRAAMLFVELPPSALPLHPVLVFTAFLLEPIFVCVIPCHGTNILASAVLGNP